MHVIPTSIVLIFIGTTVQALSPQDLAAAYNLTVTQIPAYPTSPISNSSNAGANYITSTDSWSTSYKTINNNPQNIQFVADPFPNSSPAVANPGASHSNSSATVLAITYPAGSYSHETGGTQFNEVFDPSGKAGYKSMVLTYEVAFDQNFQFMKGGKLPGLRGGQLTGCSGGSQPNGKDCFSLRLMWRDLGYGEVYAYIPTPNNICAQENVRCNQDGFGTSISRATISFKTAQWTRITYLVTLNDPQYANGELRVYFNDLLAVSMQNIYYRSSKDISSVSGMYFSTFFGGNDPSWATPVTQRSYFRNIQLWAGTVGSNVTNAQPVTSSAPLPLLNGGSGVLLVPLLLGAVTWWGNLLL